MSRTCLHYEVSYFVTMLVNLVFNHGTIFMIHLNLEHGYNVCLKSETVLN